MTDLATYIGARYERLTVERLDWDKVRRGRTKSCGCLRHEPRPAPEPRREPVPPGRQSEGRLKEIMSGLLRQHWPTELIHGATPTPGGSLDHEPEVAEYMRKNGVTKVVARAEP